MDRCLQTIKSRRDVPHSELDRKIRRVVVILSGSRGGSTLLKETLASHARVASLDGELEPLLALSGNGFDRNSDSDGIDVVANARELASSILDEISFASADISDTRLLRRR